MSCVDHPIVFSNKHTCQFGREKFDFRHSHPSYEKIRQIILKLRLQNCGGEDTKKQQEAIAEVEAMAESVNDCRKFLGDLFTNDENPKNLIRVIDTQKEEDSRICGYLDGIIDMLSLEDSGVKQKLEKPLLNKITSIFKQSTK